MEHASRQLKETLIGEHFLDPKKLWTQPELLPIVHLFFLREQDLDITSLQKKFKENPDSISDPQKGVLGSAYIIQHFLQKQFKGRNQINGQEAIEILSFGKYEDYGENHIDEMMSKLDEIFGRHPD
jgi:hypothetical protein